MQSFTNRPMGRAIMLMAAVPLLAACGQSNPWDKAPESGLWQQTYSEGPLTGSNLVICYAPDQKITLIHDSQPATMSNGGTCDPVERTKTSDGWTSAQKCALGGVPAMLRFAVQGDAASDAHVHVTVSSLDGVQLSAPQSLHLQRVGDCPSGWKPSDFMRLDVQDGGEWRVTHPGDDGAPDTFTVLPSLPPELEALRH